MPFSDSDLFKLAVKVSHHLAASQRQLVTAESCTGGWVAKVLTDVPGSSAWFLGGAVAYSNALKESLLRVSAETLAMHGAVSDATVREMATGALEALGGHIACSVSGIAGPDGAAPGKPVGTVWFGWAWRHGQAVHVPARLKLFKGDREAGRRKGGAGPLTGVLE